MGETMKLFREIENTFSKYREKPAVSRFTPPNSLSTLTYGQLEEQIRHFGYFMMQKGMQSGDLSIIYMNKSPELVAIILAIILNDGVACCLNSRLRPFQVLKLSSNAKPKFIILDQSMLMSIIKSKEVIEESYQFILFLKEKELFYADSIRQKSGATIHVKKYAKEEDYQANSPTNMYYRGDSPAYCLFTSGSTGIPKGVLISRDDLYNRAKTEIEDYELTNVDCLLNLLPFSFDVGLNQLFSCFLSGAHLILLNSWFPKDIVTAIDSMGITGISAVPSIWAEMITYPKNQEFSKNKPKLRYITVSGGDLNKNQLLRLREYFENVKIYKTYGQTETFRSSILKPCDFERKITSVGLPVKGTRVFIMDEKGEIAKPNTEGEIVHYGAGMMLGYLNDLPGTGEKKRKAPETIKDIVKKGNVIYTGDRGMIDQEGYLYVLGREDGMIKTLGYRVYPKEIEGYILEHEQVKNAAVVGVRDSHKGQYIVAEVVPKGKLEVDGLIVYLKNRMASYMFPEKIHVVESLPMTENGKINYSKLKEKYEERRIL
jgi:acyl-coenzyme A synthetase/AMP-(fatty) acid ligase